MASSLRDAAAAIFGIAKGGEISHRQWNDLLNLVAVQQNRLDHAYLFSQSTGLGVADLLQRLLSSN